MYNPPKKKSYYVAIERQKSIDASYWQKEALQEETKIRSLQFKMSQLQYSLKNADGDARREERKSFDLSRLASQKKGEASRFQAKARTDLHAGRIAEQLLREAELLESDSRRASGEANNHKGRRNGIEMEIRFMERDVLLHERLRSDSLFKEKLLLREANEMHIASLKAQE